MAQEPLSERTRTSMSRTSRTSHTAQLRELDALDLLRRDHEAIKHLFGDYERLVRRRADPERKATVVGRLCFALSLHLQIEEEIFYPAARAVLAGTAWTVHALDDHDDAKALIARLDEMEAGDADFDASVAALGACIVPHMNEEQDVIFQTVQQAGLDTAALGRRMAQRQKLLREDVTRIGLPHSQNAAASWPVACRLATP